MKDVESVEGMNYARETVMMLELAVAHIRRSMIDGDESVNVLTDVFTTMVGQCRVITSAAEKLPDSPEKSEILNQDKDVSDNLNRALVAFQFYDTLTQRLEHVSHSLEVLSSMFDDEKHLKDPYSWIALQEKIKSRYTIDCDRVMFDAIKEGKSIEEALALSARARESVTETELF